MLPEGVLFGWILHSPHAHAKITKIDTSEAEKLPGVKAVHLIAQEGATVRYFGEEIAAVAAETEEQAKDGCRAIKIDFEVLPHAVTIEQALSDDAPQLDPPRQHPARAAPRRTATPTPPSRRPPPRSRPRTRSRSSPTSASRPTATPSAGTATPR